MWIFFICWYHKNETVDMYFHMCYAYEDFERQRKSLFKAIILDHSIWG